MLRTHFLQQWFGLSHLAMEEALFETAFYRVFAGLSSVERIPDRISVLRFRHLLEDHPFAPQILAMVNTTLADKGLMLQQGAVADATLFAAPSSTKNQGGERDPEMHQTKKGNQWHFGTKAPIGVEADSGLAHTVVGTAANVYNATQASALDKDSQRSGVLNQLEHVKGRIRAKVEHPFRVIKRQFGHVKVDYQRLAKNTAQLHTQFALSNVLIVRRRLLQGPQA